jgi:hypothetical protein
MLSTMSCGTNFKLAVWLQKTLRKTYAKMKHVASRMSNLNILKKVPKYIIFRKEKHLKILKARRKHP